MSEESDDGTSLMMTQIDRIAGWARVFKLGTDEPIYIQRFFEDRDSPLRHIMDCMARNMGATSPINLYELRPQPPDLGQRDSMGYIGIEEEDTVHGKVAILLDYDFISNVPGNPAPRDEWTHESSFLTKLDCLHFALALGNFVFYSIMAGNGSARTLHPR